jgi:hypothetical protein
MDSYKPMHSTAGSLQEPDSALHLASILAALSSALFVVGYWGDHYTPLGGHRQEANIQVGSITLIRDHNYISIEIRY